MRFREIFLAVEAGLLVISNAEQFCIKPTNQCTMHTCFDYTKCPINGDFKVFFYDKSHEHGHYKTDDPNEACLFVYQYSNEANRVNSLIGMEALTIWLSSMTNM